MMTVKILLVTVSLIAGAVGIQKLISNGQEKERMKRGRVANVVEAAKANNKEEVSLPAPIPLYAAVRSLDEALNTYSTVVAKPILKHSQLTADSKEIETWYKFSVDFLSEPKRAKCNSCRGVLQVPQELQPVGSNEMVVVKPTGTVVSEGVKITSTDLTFPDFEIGKEYLLFIALDPNTRIGSIELGPSGVSKIESNGEIQPVHERSTRLNTELKTRFGRIDKIKKQLGFRRFPE